MQNHPAQSQPRRGLLSLGLLLAVLPTALPFAALTKEPQVHSYLYRHALDPDHFRELERRPGDYRIEATWLAPGRDARIPLPEGTRAGVFVSSTLRAGQVPRGSRWAVVIERVDAQGQPLRGELALIEPPSGRDNLVPPTAPAHVPPGLVLRAVFWADLGPLIETGQLMPGDRVSLQYGSAQASLAWPPPPRR